ncbi:MAG TPA: Asp23/Gls24 family envelope stress response protein [Candidatus Limnocylindrales bacterium]|nr:Asp23/Gls24 family envelope stress response protein [Candidatus Limnocylindrales bacterium]
MLASPTEHEPSLSLVSRRAIGQIVRAAVAGSYGVTGLSDDRLSGQLLVRLGLRPPAIAVRLGTGIRVELRILVAAGVPVAEVARQVDSAVRYSVGQATGRAIDSVTIHVGGLRFQQGSPPAPVKPDADAS